MDATLMAGISSGTTAMGATVLAYIPGALLVGLPILASVVGVKYGLRFFRRIAGV